MYVSRSEFNKTERLKLSTLTGDNVRLILSRHCTFNKQACDIDADFNWYFSYASGNCIQFNTKNMSNLKSTIMDGPNYGLRLWIGNLLFF